MRTGLEKKGTLGTWNHVTGRIGMFAYTGLSEEACEALVSDHHINLLKSGRTPLAGLNKENAQYTVLSKSKL